jgi:hypothetical protein
MPVPVRREQGKTFLFHLWGALYVPEIHFTPPMNVDKHFQQPEGSFLDLVPKIPIPKYLIRIFFWGGGVGGALEIYHFCVMVY